MTAPPDPFTIQSNYITVPYLTLEGFKLVHCEKVSIEHAPKFYSHPTVVGRVELRRHYSYIECASKRVEINPFEQKLVSSMFLY